ncbi:MAG TPA: hypothetical protein VL426_01960 [Candidatus Binatia bacterium]|jgi:hypothetical protein|nr:hypothetical protein [Candidatus Binatia bacterium]
MRSKRSPFIRLAVEADLTVFVQAYTNTTRNNIRIRFDEGGFIPDGVFRYVVRAMANPSIVPHDDPKTVKLGDGRIKFLRGPVKIVAGERDGELQMEVAIKLPDGTGEVRKVLNPDACEEIGVRLRQIDSLLDTFYDVDDEEDAPVRRRAGDPRANGATHPATDTSS